MKIESPAFTLDDVKTFMDTYLDRERNLLADRLQHASERLAALAPRIKAEHGDENSQPNAWTAHELLAHLAETAQAIGRAQMKGFTPERIGVMLAGLEVPHCHFHVVPIRGLHDLDFGNQDYDPDPQMMDDAAETIRRELRALGYPQASD